MANELEFVSLRNKTNLAAVSLMLVSLFGFLGNVMIDYNWGTNPVSNSIAVAYWMTLRWIVPFPLNYWGVGGFTYFALFLFSFAVLNRREEPAWNVLETFRFASIVLILFELGVFYFVPVFMDKWVINALRYTSLSYITNWDLLGVAVGFFGFSEVLLRSKQRREHV